MNIATLLHSFCNGLYSEYCNEMMFFVIFKHLLVTIRFWEIFHGGPGSPGFFGQ